MKTLTKIILSLFLMCSVYNYAQQISFESIDSNNVLNILSQQLNLPDHPTNSEVIVTQYGDENHAEIRTNSKTDLTALQFGDYNYLNFDNSFQNDKAKSTITAQGNNNIIDVTGSNSISEKMQIHVKGDNMTIFMRNY